MVRSRIICFVVMKVILSSSASNSKAFWSCGIQFSAESPDTVEVGRGSLPRAFFHFGAREATIFSNGG
jgi:hypothetical protein